MCSLVDNLAYVEVAIGAVRNHRLPRLKMELRAIEMYRDDVRFKRHQVGDAADFGIGIRIRPRGQTCVIDGVIAAEPLVRAEGLEFHGNEGGLIDVGVWNVPARCEAGLEKHHRPLCVGDDPVTIPDHEVTRGLAYVDAVVGVSGMAHDSFVFFVESIHGPPSECDACLYFARMGGQVGVLPRPARRDVLLVRADAVPGREPEIGVLGGMLGAFQGVWRNIDLRKVGYRIAAWFEEQEDMLTIGDPDSPEAHAHAPAQRLDVQQSFGQRFGHEKPADCSR